MSITRRQAIGSAVALAATISAPAILSAEKSVKIAVGGKALYYYLPLSIAEYLGYFKDEGLKVEIVDFQGGSRALQAVVGGSADVVSGAFEHTISMQTKGQAMRCFVLQGRAPQVVFAVSKKTMPGYKQMTDLRGKKVGVTAPGSSSHVLANFVLNRGGVKPNEVSFIGVGAAAAAVAAIRTGQIDAFANLDPVIAQLQQDDLLTIVADTRNVSESDAIFGGPMVAGCLYAPERFVTRDQGVTQALANAIVRADRWLAKATAEELVATVPESYFLGNKAIYIEGFLKNRPALSQDGIVPEGAPAISLKALRSVDPKLNDVQVDLEAVYTNTYAAAANKKYFS